VDDEIAEYIKKFSTKAKDFVLIFDSCFAGSAQKSMAMKNDGWDSVLPKTNSVGGLGAETGSLAVDSKGVSNFVFLAASKGNETSQDMGADLGYSLYTYFMLKGLEGAADVNGNGNITSIELHAYISNGIRDLSERGGTYYQTPQIDPNINIIIAR
jgi:hypothetical protein